MIQSRPSPAIPSTTTMGSQSDPYVPATSADPLTLIRKICHRFHPIIRQLRERSEDRPPFEIEDDHDVRDIVRALLYLEFEEVLVEEWTPAGAPGHTQRDFLVQPGGIVFFVIRTRPGLGAKELSDRWMETWHKYANRDDCRFLFGFIYDPEGRIANPRRLETELTSKGGPGKVEIHIFPK